jgi:valyl-tRNA synthetase
LELPGKLVPESTAGEKLRQFTRNDFADWYLEICKIEKNESKQIILTEILKDLLKLWHPLIPFSTEIIWQEITESSMLMTEKIPEKNKYAKYATSNQDFELIQKIITKIRNARAQYQLNPQDEIEIFIQSSSKKELLKNQIKLIMSLQTSAKKVNISDKKEKIPDSFYSQVEKIKIYIPLGKLVDFEKELNRLENEMKRLENILNGINNKLKNKKFVDNAPEEIVQKEEIKKNQILVQIKDIQKQIENIN